MDYEKKYKEIVGLIKKAYLYAQTDSTKAVLEEIFPELKESEDERIKEAIIATIHLYYGEPLEDEAKEMLAWLEKQGEQKPDDKVEPKFKVGDFIVNDYCMGKVIELTGDAYLLDTGQGIPFSCEHNAHLWTIADAKNGDVLSDGTTIFIFKDLLSDGSVMSYCDYDTDSGESDAFCPLLVNLMCSKITPATKERRDTLFAKMHEAGYMWDSESKQLLSLKAKPSGKQKPVWSEEDKDVINHLLAICNGAKKFIQFESCSREDMKE